MALVLVLATFNPAEVSYFHWVAAWTAEGLPLKALAGLALLIGYVIYLRATVRSIGPAGMLLAGAFFAALIWVLVDYRLLSIDGGAVVTWLSLEQSPFRWNHLIGDKVLAANSLAHWTAPLRAHNALAMIATVMAVGLSWSHIRRRVSGQADVDDVDA